MFKLAALRKSHHVKGKNRECPPLDTRTIPVSKIYKDNCTIYVYVFNYEFTSTLLCSVHIRLYRLALTLLATLYACVRDHCFTTTPSSIYVCHQILFECHLYLLTVVWRVWLFNLTCGSEGVNQKCWIFSRVKLTLRNRCNKWYKSTDQLCLEKVVEKSLLLC